MQLALTTLVVNDYEEAIAYFVDALGFEPEEDSPATADDGNPKRWVVFQEVAGNAWDLLGPPA